MTDDEIKKAKDYLKYVDDLLNKEALANKGLFKLPKSFPVAPVFSSPVTITPSSTQVGGAGTGIFNFNLISATEGGGGDTILDGNFVHGFSIRRADGDLTHKYRFKPAVGTILGGSSGTEPGISQTDYGNYQEWYGDTLNNNPMIIKGERGIYIAPRPSGAIVVFRDILGNSNTAATFQCNGDKGTNAYYASITEDFCRSYLSGQEGTAYFGKTSSGGAQIQLIRKRHNCAYSPFRDGWQIEGCDDFIVENETIINAGRRNNIDGTDQKNGWQVEYSKGIIRYCVYDNSVNLFTLFANGVTIQNNYMSSSFPAYIGKSDDLSLYYNQSGLNSRIDGSDIIIENNYFKNKGAFTYAMEIAESKANVIIRNNIFQDYTTAILDSRGTHTNTITGGIGNNGNVALTVIEPTYVGGYSDPNAYNSFGRLHEASVYWPLKFGYRNPFN